MKTKPLILYPEEIREPKERPIIFSGEMVRAILDGRKSQTRRIIKPQPRQHKGYPDPWAENVGRANRWTWFYKDPTLPRAALYDVNKDCQQYVDCPYGQPGAKLWVRETFCDVGNLALDRDLFPKGMSYRSDCNDLQSLNIAKDYGVKWKSSIFMPRSLSRITLEIVTVRVERLQDIKHRDLYWGEGYDSSIYYDCPISWFIKLWESINGKGSWNQNPFVWVIEFKRVNAEVVR
jgi:hypothetical protein